MGETKHPIIAHGELYVEPISRKQSFSEKKWPHEFEEAKEKIIKDIESIREKIKNKDEVFLDEKVFCIRLEPKMEAKSYVPDSLMVSEDMKIIGGRKYSFKNQEGKEEKAKLYFFKTKDTGLERLAYILKSGDKDNVEKFRKQVRSIKDIDLLRFDEKIQGVSKDWKKGLVEIVLHPVDSNEQSTISSFLRTSKLRSDNVNIKSYEKGLIFISAICERKDFSAIERFNLLRSVHPMGEISIDPLRTLQEVEGPRQAKRKMRSLINVGMFDGGINDTHSLLNGYVKANDLTDLEPAKNLLLHGNSVCGAILYGHLGGKKSSDILPNPSVFVESFRVLPIDTEITKERDAESVHGLYAIIDQIEDTVKKRRDIKLFNLSFGPKEPILDDNISRFTYALDRLTYKVRDDEINPLFCVAVGNDGDKGELFNRIQVPSDMVNGLAVGAYAYNLIGGKIRTEYSCIGPGREGAKTKPDLLDFGGSYETPFVVIGSEGNKIGLGAGTSLATPVITGKIGCLMSRSLSVTPHMGRTLLIHKAKLFSGMRNDEEGFGYCAENVDDVLECSDNVITILYSGEIPASSTLRLPIFSPGIDQAKGKVTITWTITTIVNPDISDTDAYTNNCIEDTFYPNSMVFNFQRKKGEKRTLDLTDPEDIGLMKELMELGYRMSDLPVSSPSKTEKSEKALRNKELKWDTVIKKTKTMFAKSLLNPFLTLHAIGRNGYEHENIRYFAAVTLEAKGYKGRLYDSVLQTYNNLQPIDIQNINRVMVPIK